ncbi:HlyD family efflux transporter periplasmic adaptor subunit [Usitatibacter palustris]|uniref:Colicin V secretion protein CvaA n=1 Tax=Usitatibacter palustris TaxID=2732487 RepID=A0A6M4HAD6_9PROT|nr:HlyD family efflux transporter periplasmic adaptor subunit [Usitatibacter palustris]QJR16590.1 Colicin V secretion protein CvaA [Usitatibacter palustris]
MPRQSSRSIFRSEVADHARQAWLGRIVLIRPLSFTVLAIASGSIALIVLAFIGFGEHTKKATVSGMLVPDTGLVRVFTPQPGVVVRRFVAEGDRVNRGEPLFVIADVRKGEERDALGAVVARRFVEREQAVSAQGRLLAATAETERRGLIARRDGLRIESAHLDREIQGITQRAALSRRGLDRMRELERKGFVSPSFADQRNEDVLDQEVRLESLRRAKSVMEREIKSVENDLALIDSRAATQAAALAGQRAALEQERIEREVAYRATVTASQSGTVSAMLAEQGQGVTPGLPLLSIVPEESKLEAHLFAPSRAIGFVRVGQDVLLRFPAFPFQKFGAQKAKIVAVSRSAQSATDMGFTPPDGSREPMYRIKVALDAQVISAYGRPVPLQAGMLVDADIHLDRRRIIEWVFEPLISLASRA